MKKEQDLNLVNEITFILNKMGIPVDDNRLLESKLLLSEGVGATSDDVVKAINDFLGLTTRSLDAETFGHSLTENPIVLNLPKVGSPGKFTKLEIRSIDELIEASASARSVYGDTMDNVTILKNLFENTPNIRTNLGKIILSYDVNNTINRYVTSRKGLNGLVPDINGNAKIISSRKAVKDTLNSVLENMDKLDIETYKVDLLSGTFDEVILSVDKKLKILENQVNINKEFIANLKTEISLIKGLNLTETETINELVAKVEKDLNDTITSIKTDLAAVKETATTIKGKGIDAENTIREVDPEVEQLWKAKPETTFEKVVDVLNWTSRAVVSIAESPVKGTEELLRLLNWVSGKVKSGATGKEYESKLFDGYKRRFGEVRRITKDLIEQTKTSLKTLNRLKDRNGVYGKYTYDEVSKITKRIYKEMLDLSVEHSKKMSDKGREAGNISRYEPTSIAYNTRMNYLMRQLQAAYKNTTSNRSYTQGSDVNIQSLEVLAKKFNTLIDEMAAAGVPGAKDLQSWYKLSSEVEGEIVPLVHVARELDDAAGQRWWGGVRDVFAWLKDAKTTNKSVAIEAETAISKNADNMKNSVDNSGLLGSTKSLWKEMINNIKNQTPRIIGNFTTYGHVTDIRVMERILTTRGPVPGLMLLCIRETVTYFILKNVFTTLLEWIVDLNSSWSFHDDGTKTKTYPLGLWVIKMLEKGGDKFDSEKLKMMSASFKNWLEVTWADNLLQSARESVNQLTNKVSVPFFLQSGALITLTMTQLGYTQQQIDKYLNREWTMFNSIIGDIVVNSTNLLIDWKNAPTSDMEKGLEVLSEKIDEEFSNVIKGANGYYGDIMGSAEAIAAADIKKKTISNELDALSNATNGTEGWPKYLNNTYTTNEGTKETLKDGLLKMIYYKDEPLESYTFSDGEKYNFTDKFSKKDNGKTDRDKFEKWWAENNNVIGIQDGLNFYPIYPRGNFSDEEISKFKSQGSPNNIDSSLVLIYDPKSKKYYKFSDLDKIIPEQTLGKILNVDNEKRKVRRLQDAYEKNKINIEKNEGANLKHLISNKEVLTKKIEEYESLGYNDKTNLYYNKYKTAKTHRDGSDGKKVKTSINNVPKIYISYDDQIKIAKDALAKKTNENNKLINDQYNESVLGEPATVKEENKSLSYSNIINEYLSLNNIHQPKMRNLKSKLIESKRFDQDDYKHWKDTFTFQAVDEKNPGKYKDVKLNMDDVMDRIPHYRKKYDEDDSFVRAVVDTHENVVRLMFTKDLANIREGYTPTGFAMILQQIREGRGEMEIWSVARPASGNWFLVKGDFTPKELTGMDLEKNEPADKEPKKRENSLETLKKKELTSAQGLKNDERSGFNELPKILKQKLKEKFNNGWTTEEPPKKLQPYYTNSEISSVFGDNIKIYKLNASEDFFNLMSSSSEGLPIKRGFCRSIQLSKNNEDLTDEHMVTIKHILNVCKNKFNGMLGISNIR